MTPLTKANRRIHRLECCLRDVLRWCNDRNIALNAHGADRPDCEEYRALMRLCHRVWRPLPPTNPLVSTRRSDMPASPKFS
jgi:hypothetical protein